MSISLKKSANSAPMEGERALLQKHSKAFLRVISANRSNESLSRDAIALWCQGMPAWYDKWFWRSAGIKHKQIPTAQNKAQSDIAWRVANDLCREISRENATPAFLLRDAYIFAQTYKSNTGNAPESITINRSSWPAAYSMPAYMELFDLVNIAALESRESWPLFVQSYKNHFADHLQKSENAASTINVLSSNLKHLCVTAKTHPLLIVDSGMQGTFALAAANWIEMNVPNARVDIRLAVVYPWLTKLFKDRFFTDDPKTLLAIEHISSKEFGEQGGKEIALPRPERKLAA